MNAWGWDRGSGQEPTAYIVQSKRPPSKHCFDRDLTAYYVVGEQMSRVIGPQSCKLSFPAQCTPYIQHTYSIQISRQLGAKMPCHDADCVIYQYQRSLHGISVTTEHSLTDWSRCPAISDDSQPDYIANTTNTHPVTTDQLTLCNQVIQLLLAKPYSPRLQSPVSRVDLQTRVEPDRVDLTGRWKRALSVCGSLTAPFRKLRLGRCIIIRRIGSLVIHYWIRVYVFFFSWFWQ